MTIFEIIQKLIDKHQFKSYLEIGTQQSNSGASININRKIGVDPNPVGRKNDDYTQLFLMTSNTFFEQNKEKFDVIFIDGDHSYQQSKMDFINSLKALNDNGIIVMHDCLPHCKEYTSLLWNGEVFKTIYDIHLSEFSYCIVDSDHGCAIINNDAKIKEHADISYADFILLKRDFNIISVDEFEAIFSQAPKKKGKKNEAKNV
jgi:hypothetical protein